MGREKKESVAQKTQAKQQSKTIDVMAETQNSKVRSCPLERRWITKIVIALTLPYRETMGYNILLLARLVTKSQAQYVAQLEHKREASICTFNGFGFVQLTTSQQHLGIIYFTFSIRPRPFCSVRQPDRFRVCTMYC